MKWLALLPLILLLAACGDSSVTPVAPSAPKLTPGATPQETFEAMRACTLAKDWNALYALNAPSERAESEDRWSKLKLVPESEEVLTDQAARIGRTLEEVRAMDLKEYFIARNAFKAEGEDPKSMQMAKLAEFVSLAEAGPDTVMLKFRVGHGEMEMPLKQEGGTWYLWKMLTALSSL